MRELQLYLFFMKLFIVLKLLFAKKEGPSLKIFLHYSWFFLLYQTLFKYKNFFFLFFLKKKKDP